MQICLNMMEHISITFTSIYVYSDSLILDITAALKSEPSIFIFLYDHAK
jgi:hypothetical protein